MAIIEVKKIIVRRKGVLFSGKVLEGKISINEITEGDLVRPYFGKTKVRFKYPIAKNFNAIMSINGKFGSTHTIAKADDNVIFHGQYIDLENDKSFSKARQMTSNKGKMPLYLLSGSDTKIPDNDALKNILNEQEKLYKKDVKIKSIWHPKLNNMGLVLQGGGIAGAFGAGALGLLDKNNLLSKKYIKSIGAASTGSLTAASLIAGQNIDEDKITEFFENDYLELKEFSDIGRLRSEVRDLMNNSLPIKQAVETALYGKAKEVDYFGYTIEQITKELNLFEKIGAATMGVLLFGGFGPLGAITSGLGLYSLVKSNIEDAVGVEVDKINVFRKIRSSLATLEPTREKLHAIFASDIFKSAKIKNELPNLRIAITSYETGATAYFTEKGTLLYPKYDEYYKVFLDNQLEEYEIDKIIYDHKDVRLSKFADNQDIINLLIEACLTSGSFPAIFDPKVIVFRKNEIQQNNKEFKETFYDGGIRENLPINVIRNTEVSSIIAIHNSPVNEIIITPNGNNSKPPINIGNKAATHSAEKYALRAVNLINNENIQEDMGLKESYNLLESNQLDKVIHIAPSLSIIGLTETNPLRIKLAMFYGYMRAYDELYLAKAQEISNVTIRNKRLVEANKLRENTDQIILHLLLAIEQPIELIRNSLLHIRNEGWDTYESIKKSFDNDLPDFIPIKELFNRVVIDIQFVALSSKMVNKYYSNKNKILDLYKERLDFDNDDDNNKFSLPYDKEYNLFLTQLFFSSSWASSDLYPLKDAKNLDYYICAQGINKIVNMPKEGLGIGGNFRITHYNHKKTDRESETVWEVRNELNIKIDEMIEKNLIIRQDKKERKSLYTKWKRENNVTN